MCSAWDASATKNLDRVEPHMKERHSMSASRKSCASSTTMQSQMPAAVPRRMPAASFFFAA